MSDDRMGRDAKVAGEDQFVGVDPQKLEDMRRDRDAAEVERLKAREDPNVQRINYDFQRARADKAETRIEQLEQALREIAGLRHDPVTGRMQDLPIGVAIAKAHDALHPDQRETA